MANSSDYPNELSTAKIRMAWGDADKRRSYHPPMPRKSTRTVSPATGPDWYLREWMATLSIKQADLARLTGWSKATVSDIYNGRTAFYREALNTIATALNVKPHELLLHPDDAMALRRLRNAAAVIVSSGEDAQLRLAS
jgi:DNA-binding Xre family transcriptional regulator